jgi:hypothetical protein
MKEDGFTVIEIIIVLVMTSVFTTIIMFFTFNFWRYGYSLGSDLDTFVTRLNAGDFLRESIGSSSGFISQNSIADTNAMNPVSIGSSFWQIKHAIPGNVAIGASNTTTPFLYYKRYSVDTTNAYIMNGVQPYEDEYVLYLNGTTHQLLLRTLANTSANGNKLHTSCPASLATTNCPADRIIASDLSSIDIRFFSRSGNTIDWTSIFDSNIGTYAGPDYPAVEVLELTLNISKKAVFQTSNTTQSSTEIRIALRNT